MSSIQGCGPPELHACTRTTSACNHVVPDSALEGLNSDNNQPRLGVLTKTISRYVGQDRLNVGCWERCSNDGLTLQRSCAINRCSTLPAFQICVEELLRRLSLDIGPRTNALEGPRKCMQV